jgi:hypothetical protein
MIARRIGTGRSVYARLLANTVARRNRLNSHPPIGVGRVVLHSRQRGDILVAWREMADRVGRAGVPGERERLAAAAAEIDLAPRTACARLLHPGGSAEGIEGRRIRPDVGERVEDKQWHVTEIIQRLACFLKDRWKITPPSSIYRSKDKALQLFVNDDKDEFKKLYPIIKDVVTFPEFMRALLPPCKEESPVAIFLLLAEVR